MMPCCGKCYTDCDDEGYWTPDRNTIEGKCGYGTCGPLVASPSSLTLLARSSVCYQPVFTMT
jgi:hypothetical protein